MEITVTAITHKNVVSFESPFGNCVGIWSNGTPALHKYTVELDLAEIEDANMIQPSSERKPSLYYGDDLIHVCGLLEDYEDDGFLSLRLGDCLLCVETSYQPRVKQLVGQYVALSSDCLYLYNCTF